MIPDQRYPPPRIIAVDIDGTLVTQGRLSSSVVTWCRDKKTKGARLMLWSARGIEYANQVADHFELRDLFDDVVGKPGYIIDDQGWNWTRYTVVVPESAIRGMGD